MLNNGNYFNKKIIGNNQTAGQVNYLINNK